MRRTIVCLLLFAIPVVISACGQKKDDTSVPPVTMPHNNDAPEAKTAGGAPSDPSIVYPGGVKGKRPR